MTELRHRMIEDMKLHGLANGTCEVYVDAIKALGGHYGRSPALLSEQEVRQYILSLEKTLARSTIKVRVHAIKFLYGHTLHYDWPLLGLVRIKSVKKVPVILSPGEVLDLLSLIRRPEARMCLTFTYACGLRISEAIGLTANDIDGKRMMVCIRDAKGSKDRYVPLPQRTYQQLRSYWKLYRPSTWLFPSKKGTTPICAGSVRRCLKAALEESRITKHVTCHTLRHSYATELLDQGLDIRIIQAILGHKSLKSTMVYVHMTEGARKQARDTINKIMDIF